MTQLINKHQVDIISTGVNPTHRTKNGPVDINIPLPVLNLNLGRVDLVDQYRPYHSMGRPGMKWWRFAMWFVFQVTVVNSWLLLLMKKANPKPHNTPQLPVILLSTRVLSKTFSKVPASGNVLEQQPRSWLRGQSQHLQSIAFYGWLVARNAATSAVSMG